MDRLHKVDVEGRKARRRRECGGEQRARRLRVGGGHRRMAHGGGDGRAQLGGRIMDEG